VELEAAAAELYRRTLTLDPANELANYRLGIVLRGSPEGVRLLQEVVTKYGETGRRRFYLGSARFLAGDLGSAEAEYRRALELSPDDWAIYPQLGVVLSKVGRAEEARADWRQGLERTRKLLGTSPRNDRLHGSVMTLAALLGDRGSVDQEERTLATFGGDGNVPSRARARALLGDYDTAVTLWLEHLSAGGRRLYSYCDAPALWGLEGLVQHPRFPELLALRKQAQAELLARYPIA
jgi:tetratricopeptide (TPR) repeat protein